MQRSEVGLFMNPNNPHSESNFCCFAARSRPIVTTAWWADFVRTASAFCHSWCCLPLLLAANSTASMCGGRRRPAPASRQWSTSTEPWSRSWALSCSNHLEPTRGRADDDVADAKESGNGTAATDGLNAKEFALLRSVVAARAPSRLLVFGLSPQLLALAAVNSGQGAATAFVTDSAEDADSARGVLVGRGPSSSAAVHRARYPDPAGEAWAVLRRARSSPVCRRPTGTVRKLGYRLALTSLPREVLDARWDVVVVDGPSGAGPGEPGRMGAIYTTAALARATGGRSGGRGGARDEPDGGKI